MREKLDLSEETIKRILKAETLQKCKDTLNEALPGIWPDVYINQLPDVVNQHMLDVMRRNAEEIYDPPPDPNGVFGILYAASNNNFDDMN